MSKRNTEKRRARRRAKEEAAALLVSQTLLSISIISPAMWTNLFLVFTLGHLVPRGKLLEAAPFAFQRLPTDLQYLVVGKLVGVHDHDTFEARSTIVSFALASRQSYAIVKWYAAHLSFDVFDIDFVEEDYPQLERSRIQIFMQNIAKFVGPQYRRGHWCSSPFLSREVYGVSEDPENYYTEKEHSLCLRYKDCYRWDTFLDLRPAGRFPSLPNPYGMGEEWYAVVLNIYKSFDYTKISQDSYEKWMRLWKRTSWYEKMIRKKGVVAKLPHNVPREVGWWALKK